MSKKCHEGGNKHNFQPRFSVTPPSDEVIKELAYQYTGSAVTNQIEQSQTKKYEQDVCVWCGKVVEIPADQGNKKQNEPEQNMEGHRNQAFLKFVFRKRMNDKYHDHGTHSSCSAGGLVVYIWEYYRAKELGIKGDPFVEIGAIVREAQYHGCQWVFKPDPNYPEGTYGGLSVKALDMIKQAMNRGSRWWDYYDNKEYWIKDNDTLR